MMLSGVEFPLEPSHLDDQSAEPALERMAWAIILEAPETAVRDSNPKGLGDFVLLDRPDESLGVSFAAILTTVDAGKLEIFDYPGEYAQRFDGVDAGGNDSIWIDIGFPVRDSSSGGTYKPLFAFYVEDLDNRVNVNVHGNVMVGGDHSSSQGWGPWEVSLGVNIVDYIDEDEINTPYNVDSGPGNATHTDWLVHLDRQIVSPVEFFVVSDFVAGRLTQRFILVGAGFGPEHHVPWFDEGINPIDPSQPPQSDWLWVDPNNPNAEITIVAYSSRPTDGRDLAIIVAAGPGAGPHVKLNDQILSNVISFEVRGFNSYQGFMGGVFVAAGDVNADGIPDIIVGAGAGAPGGDVKVFSGNTGFLMSSFLAYPAGFSGGVVVAGGDVNGDGRDDIITAPGNGLLPICAFDGGSLEALDTVFAQEAGNATGLFIAASR